MNYYISDLHLFHEASIRFDNRPFGSLDEMHEAVVSRWNNKINKTIELSKRTIQSSCEL